MTSLASPGAPSGSRRFWVVVLCFGLANAAAWVGYHHAFGPHRRGLLRIERFSPGDGATLAARPVMLWKFNLPVSPRRSGSAPPVRIVPALAGEWQWRDDRTLSFVPASDLPKATKYTLSIAPESLGSADGYRLARPFVATVQTEPLKVLAVRQTGFEEGDRYVLEIEFNDRVVPADVLAKLSVRGPAGNAVSAKLHGEAAGNVVRLITAPVSLAGLRGTDAARLTVRVAEGLAGTSGPLGLEDAVELAVAVGNRLFVNEVEAHSPANGQPWISLHVNDSNPDPEPARQVISLEPGAPFTVQSHYSGWRLCGDFAPGTRYAIKIAEAPKGVDLAKYPRPNLLSVYVPDREKGMWFEHEEGYLGSRGNRTVLAHAVNVHKVKLAAWRAYDNNVVGWRNASSRYRWQLSAPSYSRPVATRTIELPREKNKVQDIRIALDDLLPGEAGQDGVYRLSISEAPDRLAADSDTDESDDDYSYAASASAVFTLSDIGLSAQLSARSVTAWAVSLSTAEPLARVRVRLFSTKNQLLGEAVTDADGLARIGDIRPAEGERPRVLLAEQLPAAPSTQPSTQLVTAEQGPVLRGLTWLDLPDNEWTLADADVAGRAYLRTGHEAFVYTDRGVYRPGETVHLRAIVRDAKGSTPAAFPVRWQIRRPDLRSWRNQVVMLDADGTAQLKLQLPNDLVTGRWSAHIMLPGDESAARESFGKADFQVEEYLPNRLKVRLTLKGAISEDREARRASIGEVPVSAAVQADYLFGRPAAGLGVGLSVRLDASRFAPVRWSDWTFGDSARLVETPGTSPIGAVPAKRVEPDPQGGLLDDNGLGQWDLNLRSMLGIDRGASTRPSGPAEYCGPWRLSVAASVRETGGRAVAATEVIEVDALPWYIGLRGSTTSEPNTPTAFEVNLVTPEGNPANADTHLEVALFRESWNSVLVRRHGRYEYESHRMLDPVERAGDATITVVNGRANLNVTAPSSGAYVLRVSDPKSGALSSLRFFAGDGHAWEDNICRERPERLELVMLASDDVAPVPTTLPTKTQEKTQFRVGDRPIVLVRSPFAGRLLLTVQTDEVLESHVIEMPASQVTVPIRITEACRPNAYVTASVVRAIDPNTKWRVHRAYGTARVCVDPSDRRMAIKIASATETRPLSTLDVKLQARDASGQPLAHAAIALAAVDEGILQLTQFATPDPLAFFHGIRALGVKWSDVYGRLMPEVPRPAAKSHVGGDGETGGSSRHRNPIAAERVRPVALFAGVVHTDGEGVATASFPVPQFAGTLRIMATGSAGTVFGSADTQVVVRSPLIVQASFPRFASPGDRFSVPVVVFNNSSDSSEVILHAELLDAKNPLAFAASKEHAMATPPCRVKAGGQETMRIDFVAGPMAGVARVRLAANMGGEHWQEVTELPVRPASPAITRGEYAAVAPDAPLKLKIPGGMLAGSEQLAIRVTPWPTLQLPDGLDYLERYPYGCAEQTISTAFPLVYLSDLGTQIAPGMFERQRVADKVQAGIIRLIGMQTANGGIAMWPGSRECWPWASVYAAHFITEAEIAGHRVPDDFRRSLLTYVRRLLDDSGDSGDLLECQAYGCYVLAIAGKPERAIMSRLTELANAKGASALPEFAAQRAQARLYLSMAWLAAGRRDLAGQLVPIEPSPPRAGRQTGGNVGSAVRDLAMTVNAMLMVQPDHPALPALAQRLADSGSQKQWRSTQDCAFAVMALGRYLRQCKTEQPYQAAELLLSGVRLASTSGGKSLVWSTGTPTTRPTVVAEGGEYEVRIVGPAATRGYVTWIQNGVPLSAPPDADHGLKVRRSYMDEKGQPLVGRNIRSGDLVQVRITLEAPPMQANIVVEDMLPAGLEIENPRLKTTAVLPAIGALRVAPRRPADWDVEEPVLANLRLDIRDDRLVLVGDMPEAGIVTHVYLARAVAPGTFVVPPVRAECMYDLAMNSHSGGGGRLVITPTDTKSIARK